MYKFEVVYFENKIVAPIIGNSHYNLLSKEFYKILAANLAIISPELKKTTRPPRKSGAIKSFVNHREDQSIIIQ